MLYIGQVIYQVQEKRPIVFLGVLDVAPYNCRASDGNTIFEIPNVYNRKNFKLTNILKHGIEFIPLGFNQGFFGCMPNTPEVLQDCAKVIKWFNMCYEAYPTSDGNERQVKPLRPWPHGSVVNLLDA